MEPEQSKFPLFCPKCGKPYDFTRFPLELPCGHSFCEECLTKFHSSNDKFLCFSDDKTFTLKIHDLPIPNFYRLIIQQLNKYYMCSVHKDKKMEFICDGHNEFLCEICRNDHKKHEYEVKYYVAEDLLVDLNRVEVKLNQMKVVLDDLKQRMQNIR